MKNNLPFVFIFSLFIIINTFSHTVYSQKTYKTVTNNAAIDSILLTAKNQIHSFIDMIPEENLPDYGFYNKGEFDKITFEKPYNIYTLEDTNVVFTTSWRVPISINGEYRALLTIIKENSNYLAVDFGAKTLSKELNKYISKQTIGLLRVYELQADFFIEEISKNAYKYIPIPYVKDTFYDLKDIIHLTKTIQQ